MARREPDEVDDLVAGAALPRLDRNNSISLTEAKLSDGTSIIMMVGPKPEPGTSVIRDGPDGEPIELTVVED